MIAKRIFALLFTAALASSSLAASAAPSAYYEAFDRPDIPFAGMSYAGIDLAAVGAFCDRFVLDPVGQYPALVDLYDEIYTQNELAYIAMCRNAGDAALAAESERAASDFYYASDRVYLALSRALAGPQGSALRALMPDGAADGFLDYEAVSEEETAAFEEENALIQAYYLLPYDDAFEDAAAELYLRLAALRRAEAEHAGFDSYADYAYILSFSREYTPEDSQRLQRVVKSHLSPLYVKCVRALDGLKPVWDDSDIPSGPEILDAIAAHIGGVSPELDEAMDYLRRCGLYCIGDGDGLLDMGYTTSLPAYRSAFLFNKADTRFYAFKDTVHEFGHFNAAYHDPTPMLYQYANMDVSEIQSQALELLFLPGLQDILAGEDAGGRTVVALSVVRDMLGSIVDGCLYDEFEQAVYADPSLTVEDLLRLETELYRDYGLDEIYGSDPYWPYIPHLFEQPLYYISYAMSALPALDIWLLSLDDRAAAVDAYLTVSAARTDAWFLDVLEENGLCDVTDRREVVRLANGLETRVDALIGEVPARSYTAVLIAVGAAAALAVAAGLAFRIKRSRILAEREKGCSHANGDHPEEKE